MSDEYSIAGNFKTGKISAAEYERKMERIDYETRRRENGPEAAFGKPILFPQSMTIAEDLDAQILRAHALAARCMAQVADGDLRRVDRQSAENRAKLAINAAKSLEASKTRLIEAGQQEDQRKA